MIGRTSDCTVQCTWSAVMYCKDCTIILCPVTIILCPGNVILRFLSISVIVRDSLVIMVIVGNSP